jgi:hypothetical protein
MADSRNEYEIIDIVLSILNIIFKWNLRNMYDNLYVYKSVKKGRITNERNINGCNWLFDARYHSIYFLRYDMLVIFDYVTL